LLLSGGRGTEIYFLPYSKRKEYTFIFIFSRYLLYLVNTHHHLHNNFYSRYHLAGMGYLRVHEQGEITMPIKTKVLLYYQNQSKMVQHIIVMMTPSSKSHFLLKLPKKRTTFKQP